MQGGYIKLWRKFMETSFYKDSHAVHLALHLILEANHASKKFIWNKQEIVIERGQVLTGTLALAQATGMTRGMVRRKLEIFQNIGFSATKSANKFSIITICNYNEYQDKESINQPLNRPTIGQQAANKRPTSGHKQEGKERKEEKEKDKDKDKDVPENSFPEKKEEPPAKGPSDSIKAFAEIKADYPKKNGKFLEERETFRRFCLIPEGGWPLVIQAVKNYANSKRVKDGIGVKDPKNFIGEELPGRERAYWREWVEPEKQDSLTPEEIYKRKLREAY